MSLADNLIQQNFYQKSLLTVAERKQIVKFHGVETEKEQKICFGRGSFKSFDNN